jgi:endonuclease/exonuclease/phosphatase family metal-dependent hydrolase
MERLRVLTFNVWNRSGPWEQRRALIQAGLRVLDPDVIGLQEIVQDRPGHTQAHELAEGLGYHVAFGEAQSYGDGVGFGNAVLSRWPIASSRVFPLPHEAYGTGPDIPERRCLLLATVDTPWGSLPFFVTHLSWKFHQGYAREAQVVAISRIVEDEAPASALPSVLVGDLNAAPDAAEIRYLTGLQTLGAAGVHPRSTYFADAFAWVGEGPAPTFDRTRNPFAAYAREPPRRIDYVMVAGPDELGRGEPVAARVVLDEVVDGVAPSDHFGVLAELTVSR